MTSVLRCTNTRDYKTGKPCKYRAEFQQSSVDELTAVNRRVGGMNCPICRLRTLVAEEPQSFSVSTP